MVDFIGSMTSIAVDGTLATTGIDVPITAQDGDLLLAFYAYAGAPSEESVIGWPLGWQQNIAAQQINNSTLTISVLSAFQGPGLARPEWTMSNPVSPAVWKNSISGLMIYRNAVGPILSNWAERAGNDVQTIAPSILVDPNSVVVGFFVEQVDNQSSATPPAEQVGEQAVYIGGLRGVSMILSDEVSPGGATGIRTATYTSAGPVGYGALFEIRQAPIPVTGTWEYGKEVRIGQ